MGDPVGATVEAWGPEAGPAAGGQACGGGEAERALRGDKVHCTGTRL